MAFSSSDVIENADDKKEKLEGSAFPFGFDFREVNWTWKIPMETDNFGRLRHCVCRQRYLVIFVRWIHPQAQVN